MPEGDRAAITSPCIDPVSTIKIVRERSRNEREDHLKNNVVDP